MLTGVINYEYKKRFEKWVCDDVFTDEEALTKFWDWARTYRVECKNPEVILYDIEHLSKIAKLVETPEDFYQRIAHDNYAWEYRNPIVGEFRKRVWGDLSETCKCTFSTNPMQMENYAVWYLSSHYEEFKDLLPSRNSQDIRDSFSVAQMCTMINGQEWSDRYDKALKNYLFDYLRDRFYELKEFNNA